MAFERIICAIDALDVAWVTVSYVRMPYKVPERTPAMNIEQLKVSDVRGWRSRLEATLRALPMSEPGLDTVSKPAADPRDASTSMASQCLPMVDWPPNLFS